MLEPILKNETPDCSLSVKCVQSWLTRAVRSRIKDYGSKASCSVACPTLGLEQVTRPPLATPIPVFIWVRYEENEEAF